MISQTGGHGDFRLPHEIPRAANPQKGPSRANPARNFVLIMKDGRIYKNLLD